MSFIISKTIKGDKKDSPMSEGSEEEGEEEEMSGALFAAEDMMEAIKNNDAKAFNEHLGKWFDMRPSESSEQYSNDDDEHM